MRETVAVQAPTGSGKTLAFLLAVAARLVDAGHGHGSQPEAPLALCLAPTRELALQTLRAAKPLQQLFGLRTACLYGGVDKEPQRQLLRKHPHIVIATPGR
jgi:superfamily II DNA/RNA helicase